MKNLKEVRTEELVTGREYFLDERFSVKAIFVSASRELDQVLFRPAETEDFRPYFMHEGLIEFPYNTYWHEVD